MAQTIKMLFPNLVYNSTFANVGGWQTGELSLEALKDPVLGHQARSLNANPSNTRFTLKLDRLRLLGGLVFLGHNFSLSAMIRLTYALDEALTQVVIAKEYDAFPRLYSTYDLPFEAPNWFLGTPLPEDIGRTTTAGICLLDQDVNCAFVGIEIVDPNNPDGYIDIGKVFAGPSFNVSQNYSPGATLVINDASRSSESLGGTKYFNRRGKRRVWSFAFSTLDEEEQFARFFDLNVEAGLTEELMLIPNPDDVINLQRKSFCGYIREPSPMEQFSHDRLNVSYVVEELI